LREGNGPDTGELKERIDRLSESLERLRSNMRQRPALEESLSSHALRTILARQSLLMSAMFTLTEMVEEIMLSSGKPRKPVFDDAESELLREVGTPLDGAPEPIGVAAAPVRMVLPGAENFSVGTGRRSFGSLARRRRRGALVALAVVLVSMFLALGPPGGVLAAGLPFLGKPEVERKSPPAPENSFGLDQQAQKGVPVGQAGGVTVDSGGVEVPDVSGREVDEAKRALAGVGLGVEAVKTEAHGGESGVVTETEPPAGTVVKPGKPVLLMVGGGPPENRDAGSSGAAAAQYGAN
jgi:hypothetical protein